MPESLRGGANRGHGKKKGMDALLSQSDMQILRFVGK